MSRLPRQGLSPWLPGLLLVLLALARPWLEATMTRHMALELPALFAIGWLAAAVLWPRPRAPFSAWNPAGLPALLAASAIVAFWMLPVALDAAVLSPAMSLIKVASLLAAGLLTGSAWQRAGLVMQAFFLFNGVGMTLTAGLLYQAADQQVCSVYLADQQQAAGQALVAWAVGVLGVWMACLIRREIAREQSVAGR